MRATSTSGWGWAFSLAGVGAVVTGTVVMPIDNDLSGRGKLVAGALTAGGALLVTVGQAWLKRSDAASTLAGEVEGILGDRTDGKAIDEPVAVARCDAALGAWDRSRADASELAANLLQDQKKTTKAAELSAANTSSIEEQRANQEKEKTNQEKEKTNQKQLDLKLQLAKDPRLSRQLLDKLSE